MYKSKALRAIKWLTMNVYKANALCVKGNKNLMFISELHCVLLKYYQNVCMYKSNALRAIEGFKNVCV